ncbi:MAG: amidohydrolase [Gemmatimonadota bacterium]
MADRMHLFPRLLIPGLVSGTLVLSACGAEPDDPADLVIRGGPILTMAGEQPEYVEAVAVDDGVIVYAGAEAGLPEFVGSDTEEKDLGGRTLLPGFVDPHGHVMVGGLQAVTANLLAPPDGEVTDIASLVQTLRDWAEENQEAVEASNVIIGFGYDNAQLAEVRHPTKEDLDRVSEDIPVLIVHQSGHLAALNRAALDLTGIDASSENPAGGVIQRVAGSDEPNGVLEETAFFLAMGTVLQGVGPEGMAEFARAGAENWARFGYTTGQEGRSSPGTSEIMRQVADEGGFAIDVLTYPDVLVDRDYILANQSDEYVNRFRVAGAKLTIDGSPQGFTAWRDRPYYDPVGDYPDGYVGYAAASDEQVRSAVDWAYENGLQIITHANGEAASDLLISALGEAQEEYGAASPRPVLIHGQFLREDQVDAYRDLDVIPSLFPMHTFYWGDWHCDHTVGPELCQNISPTGWVRDRGMIFTTHHDAPVALPSSPRVLDATVTRRSRSGRILGEDQRVDAYTALRAMTIWPAFQIFEEDRKGSIEVGKLGDFVILSDNPLEVDPTTLADLEVLETIKEGTTVWSGGS